MLLPFFIFFIVFGIKPKEIALIIKIIICDITVLSDNKAIGGVKRAPVNNKCKIGVIIIMPSKLSFLSLRFWVSFNNFSLIFSLFKILSISLSLLFLAINLISPLSSVTR